MCRMVLEAHSISEKIIHSHGLPNGMERRAHTDHKERDCVN